MTPFQLPNDAQVTDTPEFLDQFGRKTSAPAGVTPAWAAGDPAVAALTPAPDGLSAVIVPLVASGAYTYSFSDGTLTYSQEIDIVVPVAASVEPGLGPISAKA